MQRQAHGRERHKLRLVCGVDKVRILSDSYCLQNTEEEGGWRSTELAIQLYRPGLRRAGLWASLLLVSVFRPSLSVEGIGSNQQNRQRVPSEASADSHACTDAKTCMMQRQAFLLHTVTF